MKRIVVWGVVIVGIILTGIYTLKEQKGVDRLLDDTIETLIVYSGDNNESLGVRTYASVLEEEGIPYRIVSNDKLITAAPAKVAAHKPAIIYPDGSASVLSSDTAGWIAAYLRSGGYVQLASDTGSKNLSGRYRLNGGVFDALAGIKREKGSSERESFLYGTFHFDSLDDADFFEIPPGKRDTNGTMVGYGYGILTYTYSNVSPVGKKNRIYAWGQSKKGKVPLLLSKKYGSGEMLFVNLPIGALKGGGDELLLRSVLRTFLLKMAGVPHVAATPNGLGGLVLNLHIDYDREIETLPRFLKDGFFSPKLRYSVHVTAGPDCDAIGDDYGFDARGEGASIIRMVMPYGIIGSHGGWAHNWFSESILNGSLDREGIKRYIRKNNEALEKITGYKIKEYSAPNGVFPQPESTEILEELGMESYYYTGDSGSAPNRTFYGGKMLSKSVVAFPVMAYGKKASLHEFAKAKVPNPELTAVLKDLVDYVVSNRNVRLAYTHPYDIYDEHYETAAKAFIDYCEEYVDKKKLQVETMTYFRTFMLRLLQMEKRFTWHRSRLEVELHSDKGFEGVVLAIPKHFLDKKVKLLKEYDEDERYWYVPVETNTTVYRGTFEYE